MPCERVRPEARSAPRPAPGREESPNPTSRAVFGRPGARSCSGNRPLEAHQPALLLHNAPLLLDRAAAGAGLRPFDLEGPAGAQPEAEAAGEAHPHRPGVERLEAAAASADEPPELATAVAARQEGAQLARVDHLGHAQLAHPAKHADPAAQADVGGGDPRIDGAAQSL